LPVKHEQCEDNQPENKRELYDPSQQGNLAGNYLVNDRPEETDKEDYGGSIQGYRTVVRRRAAVLEGVCSALPPEVARRAIALLFRGSTRKSDRTFVLLM
jgi:hypothetical protein